METLERRQLLAAELDNFLTNQHVDLNLQHESGEWSLGVRADEVGGQVVYGNDQAVLYVGTPAQFEQRPASAAFDFIGVGAGESFHLLPQSQDPDVLFLGFAAEGLDTAVDGYDASTESKGRIDPAVARWTKATLSDVRHTNPDGTSGTGDFSLWQSGSSVGRSS